MRRLKTIFWKSILLFIEKDSASRGAAVAFFIVTSLAPVLVIIIAVAGLIFGEDAARGALVRELTGLLGRPAAELLENAIASASDVSADIYAMVVSVLTIVLIASGIFVELQAALNALWGFKPIGGSLSRLVRARLLSFGIVLAIGFLMTVSLMLEAAVTALRDIISAYLPFSTELLRVTSFGLSFLVTTALFGVIYRVLPEEKLSWRDVFYGAMLPNDHFVRTW